MSGFESVEPKAAPAPAAPASADAAPSASAPVAGGVELEPAHGAWQRAREGLGEFWRRFRKNRLAVAGGALVVAFVAVAVLAPVIAPHDPGRGNLGARLLPPAWMPGGTARHLLGTDELGRDLLSRILYGSRVSLYVGMMVVFVATTLGTAAGLASGYFGGRVDAVIQRLVDILLAFPYLVLAIALMAVMGPGLTNLMVALAYKEWVYPCRVVRAEVLAARHQEYVEAARAVGAGHGHILFREILPNVLSSVLVVSTLRVAWIILMEASLSFLGLGVQPPTPAWGSMVSAGREYLFQAWWVSTFPGLAILLTVLGINLLGEGLRDALDPRLRD